MRLAGGLGPLMLAAASALLTALVFAPAAWVADAAAAWTPLRLVAPEGTVWQGSASVALTGDAAAAPILLPGRLHWRVSPEWSAAWPLSLQLAHPAADQGVRLGIGPAGGSVADGRLRLPAAWLEAWGTPFNTVRPGGELHLSWTGLGWSGSTLAGRATVDWRSARSVLAPGAVLGDYRLELEARGDAAEARVHTLAGALVLEGTARLRQSVLAFSGEAAVAPEARERLGVLLGVLGTRNGDKVTMRWELKL